MRLLLFGGFICVSLFGGEHKDDKTSKDVKPPVDAVKPTVPLISPELEIRYLRAVVENQAVQMRARETEVKQKQVTDEIVAVCGKDYVPQDAPDGRPANRLVCMARAPEDPLRKR
jgi:hypothetical protein